MRRKVAQRQQRKKDHTYDRVVDERDKDAFAFNIQLGLD
jgi:hypothetical protein